MESLFADGCIPDHVHFHVGRRFDWLRSMIGANAMFRTSDWLDEQRRRTHRCIHRWFKDSYIRTLVPVSDVRDNFRDF